MTPGQPTRFIPIRHWSPSAFETTLKYKAKRGGSVESPLAAFHRLLSCMEAFATCEPAIDVTALRVALVEAS